MQDNCSIHTANICKNWFSRHPEIELLNAPSNSPDLNPIENFWAELTRDWETVFPRNKETLNSYIISNWEKWRGKTDYFKNLYESMPKRMEEVIQANGGITKYQMYTFIK